MCVITREHPEFWNMTSGNWQIVFVNNNLDYCRETVAGKASIEYVEGWAKEQCRMHQLSGARIERW